MRRTQHGSMLGIAALLAGSLVLGTSAQRASALGSAAFKSQLSGKQVSVWHYTVSVQNNAGCVTTYTGSGTQTTTFKTGSFKALVQNTNGQVILKYPTTLMSVQVLRTGAVVASLSGTCSGPPPIMRAPNCGGTQFQQLMQIGRHKKRLAVQASALQPVVVRFKSCPFLGWKGQDHYAASFLQANSKTPLDAGVFVRHTSVFSGKKTAVWHDHQPPTGTGSQDATTTMSWKLTLTRTSG